MQRDPPKPDLPVHRRPVVFQADVGGVLKPDAALLFHLQDIVNGKVPEPRRITFIWAQLRDRTPFKQKKSKTRQFRSDQLPEDIAQQLQFQLPQPYRAATWQLLLELGEDAPVLLQEIEVQFIQPPVATENVFQDASLILMLSSDRYNLLNRELTALENRDGTTDFRAEWVFIEGGVEHTVRQLPKFTRNKKLTRSSYQTPVTVNRSGAYVLYLLAAGVSVEIYRLNVRVRLNTGYTIAETGERVQMSAATTNSTNHQWLAYRPPLSSNYLSILLALQERALFIESTVPHSDEAFEIRVSNGQRRWNFLNSGPSVFPLIVDRELSVQLTTTMYTSLTTLDPTNEELAALATINLFGILSEEDEAFLQRKRDLRLKAESEQLTESERRELDSKRLVGMYAPDNPNVPNTHRIHLKRILRDTVRMVLEKRYPNLNVERLPGEELLLYKMLVSVNRLSTAEYREFTELDERSAFLVFGNPQPSDTAVYMCFERTPTSTDDFYKLDSPAVDQMNEMWSLSGIFSLSVIKTEEMKIEADVSRKIDLPDIGQLRSANNFEHIWVKYDRVALGEEGIDLDNLPVAIEPFDAVNDNAGSYARVFIESNAWDPLPFHLTRRERVDEVKTLFFKLFNMIDAVVEVSFTGYETMGSSGKQIVLDARRLISSTARNISWSKNGVGILPPITYTGTQLTIPTARLRDAGTYRVEYNLPGNRSRVVNLVLNVRGHCARCDRMVNGLNNWHGSCHWHTRHVNAVTADSYLRLLDTLNLSKVRHPLLEKNSLGELVEVPYSYTRSPYEAAFNILADLKYETLSKEEAFRQLEDAIGAGPLGQLEDRAIRNPFSPDLVTKLFTSGIVKRNPNCYYGLTIHPSSSLHEEWLCCGQVPSHPGCWIGVHSEDPVPDLHDYKAIDPVRGSEHINYPETHILMHNTIVAAFASGRWFDGVNLEAQFNRIHGGVATVSLQFHHEGGDAALARLFMSQLSRLLSENVAQEIYIAWKRGTLFGLWQRNDILACMHKSDDTFVRLEKNSQYGVMFLHKQKALYDFMRDVLFDVDSLNNLLAKHTAPIVIPRPVEPKLVLPAKAPPKKQPPSAKVFPRKPPPSRKVVPKKQPPSPKVSPKKQPPSPKASPKKQPPPPKVSPKLRPVPAGASGRGSLQLMERDLSGGALGQRNFGRMSEDNQDLVFEAGSMDVLNMQDGGPLKGWKDYFGPAAQIDILKLIAPLFQPEQPLQSRFIGPKIPPTDVSDTQLKSVVDAIIEHFTDVDPDKGTKEWDVKEWAILIENHNYDVESAVKDTHVADLVTSIRIQYHQAEFEDNAEMRKAMITDAAEQDDGTWYSEKYDIFLESPNNKGQQPRLLQKNWHDFIIPRLPGILQNYFEEFIEEEEEDETDDVPAKKEPKPPVPKFQVAVLSKEQLKVFVDAIVTRFTNVLLEEDTKEWDLEAWAILLREEHDYSVEVAVKDSTVDQIQTSIRIQYYAEFENNDAMKEAMIADAAAQADGSWYSGTYVIFLEKPKRKGQPARLLQKNWQEFIIPRLPGLFQDYYVANIQPMEETETEEEERVRREEEARKREEEAKKAEEEQKQREEARRKTEEEQREEARRKTKEEARKKSEEKARKRKALPRLPATQPLKPVPRPETFEPEVDDAAAALLYLYQLVRIRRALDNPDNAININDKIDSVRTRFEADIKKELLHVSKYAFTTRRWQPADLYIYYWVLFRDIGFDTLFHTNYYEQMLDAFKIPEFENEKGFQDQFNFLLDTESMEGYLNTLTRKIVEPAIRKIFELTHNWKFHGRLVEVLTVREPQNRGILSTRLKRLLSGRSKLEQTSVDKIVEQLHGEVLSGWKIPARLAPLPDLENNTTRTRFHTVSKDKPIGGVVEMWTVEVKDTFVNLDDRDFKRLDSAGQPVDRVPIVEFKKFITSVKSVLEPKEEIGEEGETKVVEQSTLSSTSTNIDENVPSWINLDMLHGVRLYPVITAPRKEAINDVAQRIADWETAHPDLSLVSTRFPTKRIDELVRSLSSDKLAFDLCQDLDPEKALDRTTAENLAEQMLWETPDAPRYDVYSIDDHQKLITVEKQATEQTAVDKLFTKPKPKPGEEKPEGDLWTVITKKFVKWFETNPNELKFSSKRREKPRLDGLKEDSALLIDYLDNHAKGYWRTVYGDPPRQNPESHLQATVTAELFESVRVRIASQRSVQKLLLQQLLLDHDFAHAIADISKLQNFTQNKFYNGTTITNDTQRIQHTGHRVDVWPSTLYMVVKKELNEKGVQVVKEGAPVEEVVGIALWKQKPGFDPEFTEVNIGGKAMNPEDYYNTAELAYLCISRKAPATTTNALYALYTQGALDALQINNTSTVVIRPAWWYEVLNASDRSPLPQIYEVVKPSLGAVYGDKFGYMPTFLDNTTDKTVWDATGPYNSPAKLQPSEGRVVQRLVETLYYDSNKSKDAKIEHNDSSGLFFPELSRNLKGVELRTVGTNYAPLGGPGVDVDLTRKKTQEVMLGLGPRAELTVDGEEQPNIDMFLLPKLDSKHILSVWTRLDKRIAERERKKKEASESDIPTKYEFTDYYLPDHSKADPLQALNNQLDYIISQNS